MSAPLIVLALSLSVLALCVFLFARMTEFQKQIDDLRDAIGALTQTSIEACDGIQELNLRQRKSNNEVTQATPCSVHGLPPG